jgi:flagellar biosynthetic protein FliR
MSADAMAMAEWERMGAAAMLGMVRVSGLMAFAPVFSSRAIPLRMKAVFTLVLGWLVAPLAMASVLRLGAKLEWSATAVIGELMVGVVFGYTLSLMVEALNFAGAIAGLQMSYSLVNVLDPNSHIETPVLGNLFGFLGTLVVIASGLDRVMIAAFARSFVVVPPGMVVYEARTAAAMAAMSGGLFLAAVEMVTPLLAATLLVELTIALMSKLSPQLPVMAMTVPAKTLVGFVVMTGSLALWPRFLEGRFAALLDAAENMVGRMAGAH